LARQALSVALHTVERDLPTGLQRINAGMTHSYEPILASGSTLTNAPKPGQSLLILLDAIQPVGVTTLILDQNNLLPALGAAASRNSILPIHVLESGTFLGLATVISPLTSLRSGSPILRAHLVNRNGTETRSEVRCGNIEVMAFPSGQSGRLYLKPLHRADLGAGPGRDLEIPVSGTRLGVVIDARGRPLTLPRDPTRRHENMKKWSQAVGG